MKRLPPARTIGFLAFASVVLALCIGMIAQGQQMIQYGFEARDPVWVQGPHDAAFRETAHRLTDESIHNGQRSETIQLEAERGTFIHYTYHVGRGPVTDDLNVSLWVRANRPGVQLLARAVFPKERDAKNPDQPLTALLPGDRYQLVNHWQQLSLVSPVKLLRQQQQLLGSNLKRDIDVADAYIDQLVLNVYVGPGETKVWIDDLEVGPVLDAPQPSAGQPNGREMTPGRPAVNHRPDEIQLRGRQLLIGGERFFLMGIRHTGTPLKVLRDAGFNTVWLDESSPAGLIEDAANLGFWIVPTLRPPEIVEQPGGRVPGRLVSKEAFATNVSRFLREQAVLCWDLGGNLPIEKCRSVINTAQQIHTVDPMRPLAADVSDGFLNYYHGGDQLLMIGAHRWPLLTSLELPAYRNWLIQRRLLLPSDTFCWTWVQTHLPDWFMTVAYDRNAGRFTEPIGPQPEQIRLLAYTAIGAGYRGLGFWSDRFLADSHMGRDRLLALALLNQEIRMLEPLLVGVKNDPQWIQAEPAANLTLPPPVNAAVLRSEKATLVLPIWMGPGSQYVPSQGHAARLKLKVPVPENYVAWEISPGRFRSYPSRPVLGGKEIILENFNLTTAIVFTADVIGPTSLVARFQNQQRIMRKDAAQWTHDQAQEELVKVATVHEELKKLGKKLNDGDDLLNTAREWLEKSRKHRLNGEYSEAYTDAQLSLRALRILMREHWDTAVKKLTTPVASPYAVSFYTLPRFWQFVDSVAGQRPGSNVLPDGDFEWPSNEQQKGWAMQEILLPEEAELVKTTAKRVANNPREGKQCLMLQMKAKPSVMPPQVLQRAFLAIHSPEVRQTPGTVVRVSGWMKVAEPIVGSPDGALIYDSAGGEPLAVRQSLPTPWKQFMLYRTVPASGKIGVTLALTGLGTVYFDDIRIEPLAAKDSSEIITTSFPKRQ
ncbi:MAG TPA: hypothetical protein VH643_38705 [Gemmataceae bacterium]